MTSSTPLLRFWQIHRSSRKGCPTSGLFANLQAISVGETETASARCIDLIASGSCPLDSSTDFPLPSVPTDPVARFEPTEQFVTKMVESFKTGAKIPRRLAWEIILGVRDIVEKDRSLVEVEVPEGVVCDVIGDTHGVSTYTRNFGEELTDSNSLTCAICSPRSDTRQTIT